MGAAAALAAQQTQPSRLSRPVGNLRKIHFLTCFNLVSELTETTTFNGMFKEK